MGNTQETSSDGGLRLYRKDTLIKGQPAQIECVELGGQIYAVNRGAITMLNLEDEWYEDVANPEAVVARFRESKGFKPDIFTFSQRLPDLEPKYSFHTEWEEIAALPVQGYDHWLTKQIKGTTRNMLRKSQKVGVEVRLASFDDEFIRGMSGVFNETPIRQGRQFCHYGKSVEAIRSQFSRNLSRESLLGAYYKGEMIGFAMIGNAGKYGDIGQILSQIRHRDKAVNNALIAKAVELCETKCLPFLVYAYWNETSLADFKRHSGFEKVRLPRYFVPLTKKGELALKLGVHRGWKALIPDNLKTSLKKLRSRWYEMRSGGAQGEPKKAITIEKEN